MRPGGAEPATNKRQLYTRRETRPDARAKLRPAVTSRLPPTPPPPGPEAGAPGAEWEAARAAARALVTPAVTTALANTAPDDLLPQARANGGAFSAMYACGDLYEPAQQTQLAMLGVLQISPSTGLVGASGILSDGWIVYASQTALYVAQTSWWWWGWTEPGVSHIHKFDLSGDAPAYAASGRVDGWLYDQFAMSEHDGSLRAVSTEFAGS